ncbi:MAG TPA: MFS transporter [Pseudomonas sp.]|nr:MFS transporter [Pseudomonas sp.]
MAMCVGLLIAAEFMPVSLLTPIAADLHASNGMVGQAISVSGLFAVISSLLIAGAVARWDRRHVLLGLTLIMLVSLLLIAAAPNFPVLMTARALLGVTIGGFWALATATIMRLVPAAALPKALGVLYTGNAVAVAFAAPIGSYLGGLIGWRGVFWALVPLVIVNLLWQWHSLPSMPAQARSTARRVNVFGLLRRRNVAFAMLGVMLSFAGTFSTFTYLRPFLEIRTGVGLSQLSFLLLGLGLAGFVGTYGASALLGRHLYRLLALLPLALAATTLAFLLLGHLLWPAALLLIVWGALNAAIPVAWSTWLAQGIADEPDAGGGLLVAAIQLAIMLGAGLGGVLLDHFSLSATWLGGAVMLLLGALVVGSGRRLRPGFATA